MFLVCAASFVVYSAIFNGPPHEYTKENIASSIEAKYDVKVEHVTRNLRKSNSTDFFGPAEAEIHSGGKLLLCELRLTDYDNGLVDLYCTGPATDLPLKSK